MGVGRGVEKSSGETEGGGEDVQEHIPINDPSKVSCSCAGWYCKHSHSLPPFESHSRRSLSSLLVTGTRNLERSDVPHRFWGRGFDHLCP
jgi:hypothetical protein